MERIVGSSPTVITVITVGQDKLLEYMCTSELQNGDS